MYVVFVVFSCVFTNINSHITHRMSLVWCLINAQLCQRHANFLLHQSTGIKPKPVYIFDIPVFRTCERVKLFCQFVTYFTISFSVVQ